ncbi:MAG: hypothetical protein UY50_C0022G0022 [Parcubacteria group bacterium GW2011_GWA2_49_9]|nr:MAG: hypothetical protein UY50_C0022G0022 [Parcubacteria group bacterium GW2011_GWA2_49_9]
MKLGFLVGSTPNHFDFGDSSLKYVLQRIGTVQFKRAEGGDSGWTRHLRERYQPEAGGGVLFSPPQ